LTVFFSLLVGVPNIIEQEITAIIIMAKTNMMLNNKQSLKHFSHLFFSTAIIFVVFSGWIMVA